MKFPNYFIVSAACILLGTLFIGCNTTDPKSPNFSDSPDNTEQQYWLDEFGNVDSTEISTNDFYPATDCQVCHVRQYDEWYGSMHAYSMKDPVFFSGWEYAQEHYPAGERFCIQCHSPVAFVTGFIPGDYIDGEITADLLRDSPLVPEIIKEGIGCNFCHSTTALSQTISTDNSVTAGTVDGEKYGAQYHLNPGEKIMYGPIVSPQENEYHQSEYNYLFHQSRMCLPCHNLNIRGETVEGTFEEWYDATAQGMGEDQSCQSCHMRTEDGSLTHDFFGVDINLTQDISENDSVQYKAVEYLLQRSVELEFGNLAIENSNILNIPVIVSSLTGHSLPSGTSFSREAWLETIVKDAKTGDILFSSGKIDELTSELELSDSNLLLYTTYLLGTSGEIITSVTDAFGIDDTQMLSAFASEVHEMTYTFNGIQNLSTIDSLKISARMRFRAFKPSLLMENHSELLARQPVFEMTRIDSIYIIP